MERFWSKINKLPSGCWEWMGATGTHGYGVFTIEKKTTLAHRYAMKLSGVSVHSDLDVCHSCDNKRCCNPKHLFIGTHADNMRDMVRKKRQSSGENRPLSKIKEKEVKRIRELFAKGKTQYQIAETYGISQPNVSLIVNRKAWAHV